MSFNHYMHEIAAVRAQSTHRQVWRRRAKRQSSIIIPDLPQRPDYHL